MMENPAVYSVFRITLFSEKHERSLAFLQQEGRNLTETKVASLLANHLLSQLLPYPSNYYLDKMSRGKTDGCPCGCGELIQFGSTHIGLLYYIDLQSHFWFTRAPTGLKIFFATFAWSPSY
jgi:hypothetical protein